MRTIVLLLILFHSLAAIAAYSRVKVDVSGLPPEKRFLASVVQSRIYDRTPPSAIADAFRIRFIIDDDIAENTCEILSNDGKSEIRASTFRSLVFGTGKFLRSIDYNVETFSVSDCKKRFHPVKPIRQVYFARHFNTWYHRASPDELKRYIEDLALWGINSIKSFASVAAVDQAWSDESESRVFKFTTEAILQHMKSLDMDFAVSGGSNVSGEPIPVAAKAKAYGPGIMRGFSEFNVCPETNSGIELLLRGRSKALSEAAGLKIDEFVYWPYDEGGCACDKCSPWGGRGYLKMARRMSEMNGKVHPGARHVVSTWLFDDDDWKGLYRYLESNKWIDCLLVDSHDEFPRYPLEHQIPGNVPIITFPEVSMWGRFPWGGTGATPLPRRLERLFRQAEPVASGFSIYSEGIFDDVSKCEIAALYAEPTRGYRDILEEYARYEFPGINPEDFVRLAEMLEDIHRTSINTNAHAGDTSNNSFANYVKLADENELIRRAEIARNAEILVERMEHAMLPCRRGSWRWRQIALRAKIDSAVYRTRNIRAEKAVEAYRELVELYHAERQYQLMCEGCPFAGYTCPPLIDHRETTKRKEK